GRSSPPATRTRPAPSPRASAAPSATASRMLATAAMPSATRTRRPAPALRASPCLGLLLDGIVRRPAKSFGRRGPIRQGCSVLRPFAAREGFRGHGWPLGVGIVAANKLCVAKYRSLGNLPVKRGLRRRPHRPARLARENSPCLWLSTLAKTSRFRPPP